MTIKQLSNLYYLGPEIEMHKHRLLNIPDWDTELKDIVEGTLHRCMRERDELETYIATIEDDFIRDIFIYRFAANMSWREIAIKVGGPWGPTALERLATMFVKGY